MQFRPLQFRRRQWSQPTTLIALFSLVLCTVLACARPSGSDQSLPSAVAANPQSAVQEELSLGTNLAGIADWSTQIPFIDGFKMSRRWITQCLPEEEGCSGSWATDEPEKLDLDEHGWVKSLPAPEDPPEYTRVATLMFRDLERYPGGQYVVLYEGEGTLEYQGDAVKDEAASRPGRDIINVTPSNQGIFVVITATDPNKTGNYLRNIHVVPIEYENTYETEIFNPQFLERIRKFSTFRFMDWMETNNSTQSEWANRPKVEDATYAMGKGVPLEIMIELANRLQTNVWFTMPHAATDDYMTNFAQMVKDRLDPNLKVYVELSNEVWNWQFQQAHYALQQGKARWGEDKGDAFVQWYGMRAAQMSDIWNQVFAGQTDRLVPIMATQTVWRGLENSIFDCPDWVAEGNQACYRHGIKAYAITGYVSGNMAQSENKGAVEAWLDQPESAFEKAFTQFHQGNLLPANGYSDTIPGLADMFQYHKQVADERGLQLMVYEGGQHLVSPDSEKLTDFFIAVNRRPEMYEVYSQLLENWKQIQGTLFMNFSDIGRPSKWGSWGVLEHVDQDTSPKYKALMDFIDRYSLR
ncbi:MAG: cellulose-binding protein [Synechococcales cyanobacterium C42_A2020_086]|nr:cellulose-binding protein [Synechococcales cyanobacterium C42_A2020_086]